MRTFSEISSIVLHGSRVRAGWAIGAVVSAGLLTAACDNSGPPTSPASGEFVSFSPRYVSSPQVTPVTAVPQSRPYPGTKVKGEASVCKDAGSPSGTYSFTAKMEKGRNENLARAFTLSPGECTIVYNRTLRVTGDDPVTYVMVTEVIPQGATYQLDRVDADDDASGFRSSAGPTVILVVNSHHGAYANFFNSVLDEEPPVVPGPLIDLGTAGNAGILAATTVTCVTGGFVNGDVSVSPGTAITGFGPCVTTGAKRSNDGVAQQQQLDLTAAYNALVALPCPNLLVADLGGTTKPAGVYCNASSIGLTGVLTLDGGGDVNANFVFQAGSTLTTAGSVVLINGAQAKNVYWQVGSSATIGTASHIQGSILAQTSITMVTGATLVGRALARTGAVTLGSGNVITKP